jgi:hypothetical protein
VQPRCEHLSLWLFQVTPSPLRSSLGRSSAVGTPSAPPSPIRARSH